MYGRININWVITSIVATKVFVYKALVLKKYNSDFGMSLYVTVILLDEP